jgi:putative FmdB family regulatory protein
MPTYEFSCRACNRRFSTFTAISKKLDIHCPECSGNDLQEFFGVPYLGGNLSNPGAGAGNSCGGGSCSSCGGSCKT